MARGPRSAARHVLQGAVREALPIAGLLGLHMGEEPLRGLREAQFLAVLAEEVPQTVKGLGSRAKTTLFDDLRRFSGMSWGL